LERPDLLEGDVFHRGPADPDERIGPAARDQSDDLFDERPAQGGRVDPDLPAWLHGRRALDQQLRVCADPWFRDRSPTLRWQRQQVTKPQNTVISIKRFMERKFGEVSEEMKIVPYEVVEGPNGDARVKASGKDYAPPEISAMILQKLKADAEAYLGESVDDAV